MKNIDEVENKMGPVSDGEPVMVTIKIRQGRRLAGVGEPGQTVRVPENVADKAVGMGYADIVVEE